MSEMYGQSANTLINAASKVRDAEQDVTTKCRTMKDRVTEMQTGWGGQGSTAFGNLIETWNAKQRTILKALDDLADSLESTEKDSVRTDEAQAGSHKSLTDRLG